MVAGEIARPVDVLVIGGGPGGYTAAARAAELGRDVVVVESGPLGGTCLNVGCIPSKALIALGHDLARARRRISGGTGLVGDVTVDLAAAQRWKDGVVDRLRDGVSTLLRGAETLAGTARFVGRDRVAVESADHVEHLQFQHAIIATGSRPTVLSSLPPDGGRIVDSTGALALAGVPSDLVVVGGGYIGIELGTAYAQLGANVTVVEATDRLLREFDDDLVAVVTKRLGALGVDVRTSALVVGDDGANVLVERGGDTDKIPASTVLVAVGRRPNTDDLQLEDAGIEPADDGLIVVDEQQRVVGTANVFAIGDVTAGPALAHRASEQGRVAAEAMCGLPSAFDQLVPMVAFCDPEVAAVGLSERDAAASGRRVVSGRGSFAVNGRALTLGEATGLVKLVVDADDGVVVGAGIVGPDASELIAELTLAIECALRLDDLLGTIHAHPTLAEAIVDAARSADRRLQRARSG